MCCHHLSLQVYTKLNNMQGCTQMLKTFNERYPGNVIQVGGGWQARSLYELVKRLLPCLMLGFALVKLVLPVIWSCAVCAT